MASAKNKEDLVMFLHKEWTTAYAANLQNKTIVMNVGDKCFRITANGDELIPELATSQEEADGRIFLHAQHAAHTCPLVIIRSQDTDVEVLALYYQQHIPARLMLLRGTRQKQRMIHFQQLADAMFYQACILSLVHIRVHSMEKVIKVPCPWWRHH